MENTKIIPGLILILALFSSLYMSCDKKAGETLDIPLEIELTDISPEATEFSILSVEKGSLKYSADNPNVTSPDATKTLKAGDPCIILSAEIKNNTDNDTILLLRADGFDVNGVQRSWVLDPGPLVGIANYDVMAQSTTRINITLNWADDLAIIRIKATVRHQIYELQDTLSTPVPESEMVRILFDEEWFYKNDMEPDPNNVRITFPKRWIETGKSDSYNGTGGIELAVPRQLLLDDNESTNPDEITVYFPNYYFNGLPDVPLPQSSPTLSPSLF